MTEAEALRLMAIPKWGDPPQSWRAHRTHRDLSLLEFGVVDEAGAAIPGLQVELAVLRSRRLSAQRLKFTLFALDSFSPQRAYQQDIYTRSGLRYGDHDYPHEHIGETRIEADNAWCTLRFAQAVERFCRQCSLELTGPVPDIDAFRLTP